MKKIGILTIILAFGTIVYAADQKLTELDELAAAAATDIMYIVDDPNGTATEKKIEVNDLLGDLIGAFSDLNTLVSDKTLINEEDAITLDSLLTASASARLQDHRAVGLLGCFHDRLDLLQVVDVERGHAIVVLGGVIEQLTQGNEGLEESLPRRWMEEG